MPERVRTFKPGDTISLEAGLRDRSGVGYVRARFVNYDGPSGAAPPSIHLEGDGEGQRDGTVTIAGTVPERIPRGEYRCAEITAYDIHGNSTVHHPEGLRLCIQRRKEDFEGPEFGEIRFTDRGE